MPPRPGLTARVEVEVVEANTALAIGSGDVPVLSTPHVVAICERAAIAALGDDLEPGMTTVSMRVQLDHLAPTAIGHTATAEATLEKIEGRRLIFTVSVRDARSLVAAGKVTRVMVDREHFLDKAR